MFGSHGTRTGGLNIMCSHMVCALLYSTKHDHTLPWSVRSVLYIYIVGCLGLEVFSFDLLSPGKSSGLQLYYYSILMILVSSINPSPIVASVLFEIEK